MRALNACVSCAQRAVRSSRMRSPTLKLGDPGSQLLHQPDAPGGELAIELLHLQRDPRSRVASNLKFCSRPQRQLTSRSVRLRPKPGISAILASSTSAAVSMPQDRSTAHAPGRCCEDQHPRCETGRGSGPAARPREWPRQGLEARLALGRQRVDLRFQVFESPPLAREIRSLRFRLPFLRRSLPRLLRMLQRIEGLSALRACHPRRVGSTRRCQDRQRRSTHASMAMGLSDQR